MSGVRWKTTREGRKKEGVDGWRGEGQRPWEWVWQWRWEWREGVSEGGGFGGTEGGFFVDPFILHPPCPRLPLWRLWPVPHSKEADGGEGDGMGSPPAPVLLPAPKSHLQPMKAAVRKNSHAHVHTVERAWQSFTGTAHSSSLLTLLQATAHSSSLLTFCKINLS